VVIPLVVLGVSLLLTAVAVAAAVVLHARHRTSSIRTSFRCKITVSPGAVDSAVRWPRRVAYAVWVHDVLVEFSGFARTRTRTYAVHFAEGAVSAAPRSVTGLGPSPVVLAMQLDDGSSALLAAERASGALVVGPFLAALVTTQSPS
jgi:hypothetical protein